MTGRGFNAGVRIHEFLLGFSALRFWPASWVSPRGEPSLADVASSHIRERRSLARSPICLLSLCLRPFFFCSPPPLDYRCKV